MIRPNSGIERSTVAFTGTALSFLILFCLAGHAEQSLSAAQPVAQVNVAEEYLQAAADQERMALHLPPLRWDPALATAARGHALQMIAHGSISHQFESEADLATRGAEAGARFSLISENVAESPTAIQIHAAWMHSAGHRHNLLDPNVDAVGIAVIARGHQLFAVEDFERSTVILSLRQQERAVADAIRERGVVVKETNEAARSVCESDSATEHVAGFVMRYTTSQLTKLPEQLRLRLEAGKYGSAAVGACEQPASSQFAMYRVGVLLYR